MSTEKLSELSKPVGYYRLSEDRVSYYLSGPTEKLDEEVVPLYSQEYVSAMLARIAELEAKLATPVRLPRRAPENLASVLDGYEKWLIATTFRDTWNACLDEVSRVSSGFTVEGDE